MPANRIKSCYACHKARVRCSLQAPCQRCSKRGLSCRYAPPKHARENGLRDIRPASAIVPAAPVVPVMLQHGPSPLDEMSAPTATIDGPTELDKAIEEEELMRKTSDYEPFIDQRQPRTSNECRSDFPSVSETPSYEWRDGDSDPAAPVSQPFNETTLLSTIDPSLISFNNVASAPQLMQRGRSLQQGSLTAKMILRRLADFTHLMANGVLPPFVHASTRSLTDDSHAGTNDMLARCSSNIRAVHDHGNQTTWECISYHLDQILHGYEDYDPQYLLQSMQVAVLYGILGSQNAEKSASECSRLSVICIEKVGKRLFGKVSWSVDTKIHSRSQWILVESLRRMACVLYLIDLLLWVDTDTPSRGNCDTFWDMPLPCFREVWFAESDDTWNELCQQTRECNLTLGRLLLLRQSKRLDEVVAQTGGSEIAEELAEWCERADDLSMLLWMALSVEGEGQSRGSDVVS